MFSNDSKYSKVFAGFAAFLLSFGLQFNYILNHFYSQGAYCEDSGIFACLTWRSGLAEMPPALGLVPNFLQVHTAWLSVLFSSLSYLIPADHVSWFAFYMGCSYGLIAFSAYYAGIKLVGGYKPWTWALLGTCLSQSGLSLAVAGYPHVEVAAIGLMTMFWVELARKRLHTAVLFFLLAVLVREDIGFHFTALLGLLCLDSIWRRRPFSEWRWWAAAGLAGILWSVLSLLFQKAMFPAGASFAKAYGAGSLSQVWERMQRHVLYMISHRAYLWAPLLLTLCLALTRRSRTLLLALLAYLPWLLLHLQSSLDAVGTLFGYYAFPFYNSLVWVLIAPYIEGSLERLGRRRVALEFLSVCLLSSLAFAFQHRGSTTTLFREFLPDRGIGDGARARAYLAGLEPAKLANLGLKADSPTYSLAPRTLPARLQSPDDSNPVQALLYWRDSGYERERVFQNLIRMDHPKVYTFQNSRMCLAISGSGSEIDSFLSDWTPSTFLWATHYTAARFDSDGTVRSEGTTSKEWLLKTYTDELSGGRYQLTYTVKAKLGEPSRPASVEAVISSRMVPIVETKLPLAAGVQKIGLKFTIPSAVPACALGLKFPENAEVQVTDCEFRKR
jgi:hypothetical protein